MFSQGKSYINEGDSIRASRINHNYNFVRYFTRNHILVPDLSKAADLWNETEKINLFFLEAEDRECLEGILRQRGGLRPVSYTHLMAAVNYPPDGLPMLLTGESGVGKSFIARLIYELSLIHISLCMTGRMHLKNSGN